tara:strand:+ start:6977 stop:7645 length:669 start_codon:yes stop_codon:yes gene_type:complete
LKSEYIKESAHKAQQKNFSLNEKPIVILEPFTTDLDFQAVLDKINFLVPDHLMRDFEIIYIGNVREFKTGQFNALWDDGAIYVSPDQDNAADLIDDIIHEIAHSIEKRYEEVLYGDAELEQEFLAKRRHLKYLVDKPTMSMLAYNNPDYQPEFDNHLYNELGYDYLRNISSELFYSPYAITSLREYWANGFENYLLGNPNVLEATSPVLFKKILQILDKNEE